MSRQIKTLAQHIASACGARKRCLVNGNSFASNWDDLLDNLQSLLPSGSGIDSGSTIERDECTDDKIVLVADFHHMNDVGMYDGWTEHKIIVTPSFSGINLKISGRNRNDIKDYLADCFHHVLSLRVSVDESNNVAIADENELALS